MTTTGTSYGIGLSNAASDEQRRLSGAQELFDPATFRHLATIGVGAGMRCLEVGGGAGSVARHLAARVGPTGSVLVTDLDLGCLEGCDLPNVEAIVHDVTADPLPQRAFDLVHARLVLEHLPTRLDVLGRLVDALRPGGWLLVEDLDFSAPVHLPPDRQLHLPAALGPLQHKLNAAAYALSGQSGVDLEFGRDLPAHLVAAGLVDVDAEVCTRLVRGGTARTDLLVVSLRQLAPALEATGLASRADVDAMLAALASPGTMQQSLPMVSAWGRRAG